MSSSIPSWLSDHIPFPPTQTLLCALALTLPLLLLFKNTTSKSPNLPPGPPGWPVVGNLFQVALSGKPFIHYVRDLRAQFGPIFTLRMGARTLIFISSADLAREALVERSQAFANRPRENPTRAIFSCDKFTVNSALYGPEWRSLRRNMVAGMLNSARLREFRRVRARAMDRLVEHLRAEAEAEGGGVWVLKNARFAVFCILLAMCFGVEMEEETVVRIDQVLKTVLLTLMPRIDDYFPALSPFFAKQRRRAREVRALQVSTLMPLIEARRGMIKAGKAAVEANSIAYSYLDSLFELKVEGRECAPTDEELVTLCSEFINGGTDTTATAVEWAVARFIETPSMQARIYEEVVAVVGGDGRKVDEGDIERMEYLQAFVKELLRKHPPTYLSLTHAAVEPGTTLAGYDIPTDANLEIYLPPISEDPKLWNNPQKFDPERFISGGEDADITGVKGVKMIPFGAGRRICPGLAMGTTHITLMLARMVQEFEWLPHPDQPGVDMSDKQEFTVVMNRTLRTLIRPRN
ncbi:Cytochrome P450 77A2 [Acorus calamus]|uniref:Cytochrome P450 77A2 n=1 Tax=Acorus calamus TaxID=4465 RepID=A0AAV9DJ71_ACOCL|nr:Cytochrome P450 77A2 [Acorus calamus]